MYELPRGLAVACNDSLYVQMLSVCRGRFEPQSISAWDYPELRNVCNVIIIALPSAFYGIKWTTTTVVQIFKQRLRNL
jgi:hypothetical protein